MERRVVLLSRDPGLASITGRLLSNGDRIAHFRSAAELSNWSTPTVAAVVLDSQPQARRLATSRSATATTGRWSCCSTRASAGPTSCPTWRALPAPPVQGRRAVQAAGHANGRAGAVRGRDHRRLVAPRHRRAGGAGAARSLLPDQLASVPAAAGPGLGGHGRRPDGPAARLRPQRPGPVHAHLHQARRRRRRRGREQDPQTSAGAPGRAAAAAQRAAGSSAASSQPRPPAAACRS